jgi:hypothetical protein
MNFMRTPGGAGAGGARRRSLEDRFAFEGLNAQRSLSELHLEPQLRAHEGRLRGARGLADRHALPVGAVDAARRHGVARIEVADREPQLQAGDGELTAEEDLLRRVRRLGPLALGDLPEQTLGTSLRSSTVNDSSRIIDIVSPRMPSSFEIIRPMEPRRVA